MIITNLYIDKCNANNLLAFSNLVYAKSIQAQCYNKSGNNKQALNIYLYLITEVKNKIENISFEQGYILLGFLYNNLASVYYQSAEIDKALLMFHMSENIRKSYAKSELSHTYLEEAFMFKEMEEYRRAKKLLYKVIEEATIYKDYSYIIKAYDNLEEIYTYEEDEISLEQCLIKDIEFNKGINNVFKEINKYIKLQGLYFKNKNFDKAKICNNKIIQCLKLS